MSATKTITTRQHRELVARVRQDPWAHAPMIERDDEEPEVDARGDWFYDADGADAREAVSSYLRRRAR